jgi:hypothetical protein
MAALFFMPGLLVNGQEQTWGIPSDKQRMDLVAVSPHCVDLMR